MNFRDFTAVNPHLQSPNWCEPVVGDARNAVLKRANRGSGEHLLFADEVTKTINLRLAASVGIGRLNRRSGLKMLEYSPRWRGGHPSGYHLSVNPSATQKNGQNFQKDPSEIRQECVREASARKVEAGAETESMPPRAANLALVSSLVLDLPF